MRLLLDIHIWVWSQLEPRRIKSRVARALGHSRRALATVAIREATLTNDVVVEGAAVFLPHDDPADRFLVATARYYELTLVTADQRLIDSNLVPVLANR